MLHKIGKLISLILFILLVICSVIYLLVAYFYQNVFMVNTWINGVYCTGKTVEEVNTELLLDAKAPFLTITGNDGDTVVISLEDASYKEDYTKSLKQYISRQNAYLWPKYLLKSNHTNIEPQKSWDEEQLKSLIRESDVVKAETPKELDVEIVLTDKGYALQDNLYHVFQPENFVDYVCKGFAVGEIGFSLADSDAYADIDPTSEQKNVRDMWTKLDEFLACGIVYDMGAEQIVLDKSITSTFVLTDVQGAFILDEDGNLQTNVAGIDTFINKLGEDYNTKGTELAFESTRGDLVMVPYVKYGTELDLNAEKAYLKEAFETKATEVHIPKYLKEGYVRGKNDIGDTYIEVDMGEQRIYCYKDGELILETDIVTGDVRQKHTTPEGVNFVYAKQRNRILRGPGYASPVKYWMPVKGGIGIHDASWRNKFGGEIYKRNGSHGCINIPPKDMPLIYDEYEIGTPVIMFY